MNLLILDPNLVQVDILDSFISMIWTERFNTIGDFEIYTAVTQKNFAMLQPNNFIWSKSSERMMIIESREINTDPEMGNRLIVKGRSLESILERRIIWAQTVLTGNLQTGIQRLLNENAISPTDSDRDMPGLVFQASVDTAITSLTVDTQFTGDTLYDAISTLCSSNGIGFKVILDEDTDEFIFSLYAGEDRSYEQTANPFVVFSPKFENIISSNYYESKVPYKSVALVAGEGEGSARVTATVGLTANQSGLSRRELFVDARDISSTTEGGTISPADYQTLLEERGVQYLSYSQDLVTFDGEVESTILFIYGRDFFMGDIVQITNHFGQEARSRITEVVYSQNDSGINVFPTFTRID